MARLFSGLLILFMAAAIAAPAPGAPEKGDPAAGKTAYDKSCKACHGAAGVGNPAIAKALGVTIHPLASKEVQAKSDDEIRKSMLGGYGKKKPVKGLTDKQILDILAYIRSLPK